MNNLKQKSIDGIIWNLAERYGIQLTQLIVGIILARLLTPADYGLMGMVGVFFSISLVFIEGGFGEAYIQKKDANDLDASTVFYFNLGISIVFYLIFWFLAPSISRFFNQDELVELIRVSSVFLLINAFGLIQTVQLRKNIDFKLKAKVGYVSSLLSGVLAVITAYYGYGVWSLVWLKLSSAFFKSLGLWIFSVWKPKLLFSFSSLKSMFSYGSWLLFANLSRAVFNNVNNIVIGKYFPVSELGFYNKALNYQKMICQQPNAAINTVSFSVYSRLQADKNALKSSMKKFISHTLIFLIPIVVIFIVIADPLFPILLTNKWAPLVPYFQLLLLAGILSPINGSNIQLLNAMGKSKLNFNLTFGKNILRILVVLIMYPFGVFYIILGGVFVAIINTFIQGYFTKKAINYSMIAQLRDVKELFIGGGLAFLGGVVVSNYIANDYLKMILSIIVILIIFILFQYKFNKVFFYDNLKIVKEKFIR